MLGTNHLVIGASVGLAVVQIDHGPELFARALSAGPRLGFLDWLPGLSHLALAPMPMALAVPVGFVLAILLGVGFGAGFALAADLDSPSSTLGAALPKWWHALTPGHRGPTHTLWAALLVGQVFAVLAAVCAGGAPASMLLAHLVFWPYLSHLAADALTIHGVPLFAPFWRVTVRSPWPFTTGDWFEPAIAYGAALLLIGWAFDLGRLGALLLAQGRIA